MKESIHADLGMKGFLGFGNVGCEQTHTTITLLQYAKELLEKEDLEHVRKHAKAQMMRNQ